MKLFCDENKPLHTFAQLQRKSWKKIKVYATSIPYDSETKSCKKTKYFISVIKDFKVKLMMISPQ